jgi:hypothetical protein
MTLQARFNLQTGIPENKINEHTNYTNESPLDAYILQTHEIKKSLEDYLMYSIEEKLDECLEKALNDIFADFQ